MRQIFAALLCLAYVQAHADSPAPAPLILKAGERERGLHRPPAGGTIYLPRNTMMALKNTGTGPLSLVAMFSKPSREA